MSGPAARPSVESVLRATAPHALAATAGAELAERFGALDVVVRLIDYGATVLRAVAAGPVPDQDLSARSGPAARTFAGQSTVLEDPAGRENVRVHLPLTVRGDPLGVLSLLLPAATAARHPVVAELESFADALGHALLAGDRDTDVYVRSRRRKRLTLAAEMQWQLLPGRGCVRDEYVIGAHLEPAYAVGGDNFDWSADDERLVLTVTDGMSQGMDSALLTGLAVAAMRNARRAGLDVADQAALADQAVYAQYQGEAYSATLLLDFDLATGTVSAVSAGSPRIYRLRAGRVEQIALDGQLPLGMFDSTHYTAHPFTVRPGDRLMIVSTGLHSPLSATGTAYGDRELAVCMRASRLMPPIGAARAAVDSLVHHFGGRDLEADASVVCLDWRGRDGGGGERRDAGPGRTRWTGTFSPADGGS